MFWYWVLGGLLTLLFSIISLYLYADGNQDYWSKRGVYCYRDEGSLWQRLIYRLPFHLEDIKIYKQIKQNKTRKLAGQISFRHPTMLILDLDLIRNILVKDFDHFVNRRIFELNDPVFQNMLVNQINQDWKDLRSTMSPTFTTGKIKRMFGVFNESGRKMGKYLKQQIKKSNTIEMRNVCGMYTMDVIASAAFGVDSQNFENEDAPFSKHGKGITISITLKFVLNFLLLTLIPKISTFFRASLFKKESVKFLEGVVKETIRRRKELGEKRDDFLQLMLEAQKEQLAEAEGSVKKYVITDQILITQCNLFFLAGFDTTETLLIYAAYELALNPEIQERLYQELSEAVDDSGHEDLQYDVITELKYLDMVISETLRKYAPGVRLERKCNKDYQIPGSDFIIKKDTHIGILVHAIHHDPELYPNPEQFDPERFTAENKAARHPYAYMPFGMGPRNCIAMRFALVEGKAAVAHLVLNFKLSPCAKTCIPMNFSTTGIVKPADGIWLDLEARN